jgi:hypothetical protein
MQLTPLMSVASSPSSLVRAAMVSKLVDLIDAAFASLDSAIKNKAEVTGIVSANESLRHNALPTK